VRLPIAAPLCALAIAAAAGCGGGDDEGSAKSDEGADLRVTVYPQGPGGPARERRVSCDSSGECAVRADDLAPVPSDTACAQIYGGPATATVTGTLEGERVSARFKLTDSCEIERWRRNAELLGRPPRGG
jgi:hypothetical protein